MFEGIKAKIIINELLFLFFLLLFLSINFHYFVPMDTNILLSCGGKTVIGPRIAARTVVVNLRHKKQKHSFSFIQTLV